MFNDLHKYSQLMRLDKPIGIFLLLWPTLWALWIANNGIPPTQLLIIFILGVITTRSAGCIINDIADHDFDKHVTRTRERPLASGALTRFQASIAALVLGVFALLLVLQLNTYSLILAVVAVALIIFYPLSKRFFVFPQLILGIVFGGWSILIAFAASTNHISNIAWILFIAASLWTISYDTLYAIVDREDDKKIQIHSSAIWFGKYDHVFIFVAMIAMLTCLILIGVAESYRWHYYLILALLLGFVIYQWKIVYQGNPQACFKAFLRNNYVGALVFLAIFLQYL